jgi:hypothetical protein
MLRLRLSANRLALIVALGLLFGLLGCSGGPGDPAATSQSGDLAALRQQVAAQETRIATLETRVALPQPAVAQATRITILETRVALAQPVVTQPKPTTGAATVAAKPIQPTPTGIPPVTGLTTEGTTKGVASAKVTITEYVDYL